MTATNNATFAAVGLPAGLSISSSGQISGIPISAGSVAATITATNLGGSNTVQVVFTIAPKPKQVSRVQTIIDYENSGCSLKITYYSDGTFISEKL